MCLAYFGRRRGEGLNGGREGRQGRGRRGNASNRSGLPAETWWMIIAEE